MSGILVMQASYLAMKSSHSAMPILSPLVEAVAAAGVVAGAGVLVTTAVLLLFVVVVVQAIKNRPQTTDNANIVVLRINCSFFWVKPEGLKSWEIILADAKI